MLFIQFGRSCAGSFIGAVICTLVAGMASASLPPRGDLASSLMSPEVLLDSAPAHDPTTGTLAGQADTDGGAATYTVPIDVPPGRAGMQPSLALNYNSRGGDGIAGMGWSLSGTSSIHRCPQTPEQDGASVGVSYSNNDRLCLDGQRLVKVSSGAYGQSGSEYRTEVDSHARIYQAGGDLTAAASCFRVEQKDGRILHYGAVVSPAMTCLASTAHARVVPAGVTQPLSWQIEKIEDRVGNNQLYSYADMGNGEVLLSSISYTGSGASAGDRRVEFAYLARSSAASGVKDIASSYLTGGLSMQTRALQSISTKSGASLVRTVKPTYVASPYSGRLLLKSLTECGYAGSTPQCHPATQFSMATSALNHTLTSLAGLGLPGLDTSANHIESLRVVADLDGDGTRETAVVLVQPDGTKKIFLAQLTADHVVHGAVDLTGVLSLSQEDYADFDNDGRAELIKGPASAGDYQNLRLEVWNLGRGDIARSNPFRSVDTNIPFPWVDSVSRTTADVNGDGRTDVVVTKRSSACGSDAGSLNYGVFAYLNANPPGVLGTAATFAVPTQPLFCLARTGSGFSLAQETIDHIGDFDGDGLPDFYIHKTVAFNGNTVLSGVRLVQRTGTSLTVSAKTCSQMGLRDAPGSTNDDCNWYQGYATRWMDVNGDGLEDFVIARPTQSWRVHLNQGGAFGQEIDTNSMDGLDAEASTNAPFFKSFRYADRLPEMDVDGDGKSDPLVVSASQGFALKMCGFAKVQQLAAGECPNGAPAITGPDNIAYCPAYACPEDPGGALRMPPNNGAPAIGYPATWHDLEQPGTYYPVFGTYKGGPSSSGVPSQGFADQSVYHLAMLKFEQTGVATIKASRIETALVSNLQGAAAQDLYGDGLSDLTTYVGAPSAEGQIGVQRFPGHLVVADGIWGPANLPDGTLICSASAFGTSCPLQNQTVPYANVNTGANAFNLTLANLPSDDPPRNLSSAATASYLPELLRAVSDGVGDYALWAYAPLAQPINQGGIPLYTVPSETGYEDSHHYYFSSSMPVVTGMTRNNGAGSEFGFRAAVYGYTEAMYNHLGRGFQGFHAITSLTSTFNLSRRIKTTSTYHQKFPLTGKVASIVSSNPDSRSGAAFLSEIDTWICGLSNRSACPTGNALPPTTGSTIYAPVLDKQRVDRLDLASGAAVSHVETINASSAVATSSGWDQYGNLRNQRVISSDDGAGGRFIGSHTVSTTNTYAAADLANWWLDRLQGSTMTGSIAYDVTHALPTGASAPDRSVTTTYQWNNDRTPLSQTLQPGVSNQERTTTYSYPTPSYGLPRQVSITGSGITVPRTTNFTYTKDGTTEAMDGYFVFGTTNALGYRTTTERSTRDGQVAVLTDPNSLKMINTYDEFGRLKQIAYRDASGGVLLPNLSISQSRCSGGAHSSCPGGYAEDGNQDWAAWRVTRVQNGYPTIVDWFDALGRRIKHAERGLDGRFAQTVTSYDDMNTIAEQSTPFFSGSVPYFTAWNYDRLGRPTAKQSPGGELDPAHGDIVTTYAYNGSKTTIKVRASGVSSNCSSGTNLCMNMTRSYDVLGRLEQTSQDNGGTANYAVTNYWYDGTGNPVAARDAEANVIRASYDDVGHRTDLYDPDAGHSSFSYDALGEVLRQTDARGVYTDHVYDALGRLTQRTATNAGAIEPNPKVLRDSWSYDPFGGIGLLDYAQRRKGASVASLAQIWKQANSYESATKRLSSQSTTLDGQSTAWSTGYSYDSYGREQTTTYPASSGVAVRKGYSASGHVNLLANDVTDTVYWTGTSADAWGNITAETYAGNINGSHQSYASTGQSKQRKWTSGSALLNQLDYIYDSFGNLKSQGTQATGVDASESYVYDGLQRLTRADRSGVAGNPSAVTYQYRPSGNLSAKSDYSFAVAGSYQYGGNGCGPHGVSQVARSGGSWTYNCDAAGNVVGGNALTAGYDFNNQPWSVSRSGSGVAQFAYDTDGEVYERQTSDETTWFGPRGYELSLVGSQSIQRHELGPVVVLRQNGTETVKAVLRDRLGSQVMLSSGGSGPGGLPAPTLSATPNPSLDGHYTVSWGEVAGATSYVLKEQTAGGEATTVYSGVGPSWSPPSARPPGSYVYTAQACASACGAVSAALIEDVALPPPTSISASPNPSANGSYTVSWSNVPGALSYTLEELVSGGNWAPVCVGSPAISCSITGRPGGTYSYRARACTNVCGAPSPTVTETVQGGATLPPPATISASPNPSTTGSYTVIWSAVSGAANYCIQEKIGSGGWSACEMVTSTSRAYTARPSGSYSYRVQACNANGCSAYSATVIETVNIAAPPQTPQQPTASPYYSLDGDFTVSWNAVPVVPGGGSNSYRLEESTLDPNTWTERYNGAGTSWATTNRPDGQYRYRVRACNSQGCSPYSPIGFEVVRHVPDIPTGLIGSPNPSTGTFTLSWSASATATYYEVQEQLNGGAWTAVLDGGTLHGTSVTLTRGNGSYQYHVRACFFGDQVRCSVYSASWAQTVEGSTTPPAPASISGPSGCTASPRTYTISWDGVSQATSYDLHETNTSSPAEQILVTSATSQSLTRSRILPEDSTTYDYEVRACAGSGSSRQCSPYRGTAHACVGIPNLIGAPDSQTGSAYDAFGKVRNGDYSDRPNGTLDLLPDTLRGFTAHQHVDAVQLIHMNGRIYDYQLGRFLSVDPVIQFPSNTQSLNPYSYILNNPLAGRDPTGYEACTGSHIDRNDGSSCAGQGVSGGGSNSPSKEQQAQARGSSRSNGAVASGGFKGPGTQRSQNVDTPNIGSPTGNTASSSGSIPTLETVSVGARYPGGESVVPGDWSTSMNGRVLNAEWGQYLGEEESRIANGMITGFYSFQLQLVLSQFSGDAPAAGLAGGLGALRTAGGIAEEGALGYRSFSALKRAEGAAGPGVVVIGEDMQGRVIPAAKSIGAEWYKPRGKNPESWMENNRRWINKKMNEGCRVLDCGAAPGRSNYPGPTSPYYKMELNQMQKRSYPSERLDIDGGG